MSKSLITIKNCKIENQKTVLIEDFNWEMKADENWLVIGPNGGGKADFLSSLSQDDRVKITSGTYKNTFINSTDIVSLEVAAKLIQEERENDESEYIEGGVDIGRTGRKFLEEVLLQNKKADDKSEILENLVPVKLCGLESFLDTGLKYMSTGQIRRTLLARALLSKKELLILSDPFAGLDQESRGILLEFFNNISKKQSPKLILSMERYKEIPEGITHVLEIKNKAISFTGSRTEYEELLKKRHEDCKESEKKEKEDFNKALDNTLVSTIAPTSSCKSNLVEMKNVNVGWDGKLVLKNLNWTIKKGQHWLVRGPNGSGKTTLLELITGDNMQVFSNNIKIFGNRRGSGESIWDIKKRLGIVSYRLHVEYRMLGGTSIRNVIVSGLRDSIGLYGQATDMEIVQADKWLKLGGFQGRESENFGDLSYGEQRAILILRSAVKIPELLILDEPCHGLDENYRGKILQLMEKIGEGGTTTMLHVTHDPEEVLECEKFILELKPGEEPMYGVVER